MLACTRHLLRKLKEANPDPIIDWLKGRLRDLKDAMLSEINADDITIEVGLKEFAKLTTAVRREPSQRQKIRDRTLSGPRAILTRSKISQRFLGVLSQLCPTVLIVATLKNLEQHFLLLTGQL
ncbi:MAG: hypothetical protein ACFB5Z_07375 [Elainellaceae cyanobacterium]